MIYKSYKFRLENADDTEGTFEGYGGTVKRDSDGDVIVSGAYAKSIQEQKSFPLLWFHRVDEPIGIIEELKEDENGLYIKGTLDLDITKGREVYSGMKRGYISNFSVGFKAIKHDYDKQSRTRFIREAKLYEISAITKGFAANDAAVVTGVKSESLIDIIEAIQMLKAEEVTQEQLEASITHLQTLLKTMEPSNDTPTEEPSDDTLTEIVALMKRLKETLQE